MTKLKWGTGTPHTFPHWKLRLW